MIDKILKNIYDLFFESKPNMPYPGGQSIKDEELFNEPHSRYLATLLEPHAPELLHRWFWVVLPAAQKVYEEKENLEDLFIKREETSVEYASKQKLADSNLKRLPKEPQESWTEVCLTIGLSIMLFLGLLEFLGGNIDTLAEGELEPKAVIALAGAICINIAEKSSIIRHAEHANEVKNLQGEKEKLLHEKKAFWQRFQEGESPLWLATTIVVFETAFASPGLITLLPPNIDGIFKFCVFLAAGLAALINVTLAWGLALKRSDWKQQFLAKKQQIDLENLELLKEAEGAKVRLKNIDEQISYRKNQYLQAWRNATKEHQRWERDVKQWIENTTFNSRENYPYYNHRKIEYNQSKKTNQLPDNLPR